MKNILKKAAAIVGGTKKDGPLENEAQSEKDKLLADKIKRRFNSGVNYKTSLGYYDEWAEYQRFWENDQWPAPTTQTKNFPRPSTNHFAAIVEQKVAGLTYEAPELYFEPVETEANPMKTELQPIKVMEQDSPMEPVTDIDAADMLSHVARHQSERIELEELLDEGTRSAALMGTCVWFFPWDNDVKGGGPTSQYIGDIKGYTVDNADFFPGDPTNKEIQTQPWILLSERRPISEVKEIYRPFAGGLVDQIQPEGKSASNTQIYDHQRVEQDESKYVDVLHCWWKDETEEEESDPEGTQKKAPAKKESQKVEAKVPEEMETEPAEEPEEERPESNLRYVVVCQDFLVRDEDYLYNHGLYPFVAMQWLPRRKSFWGKGEGADLINNQKEENRLAGISLLSAYNNGLPNIWFNPDWVDKADVPRGPGGEVIPDKAPPGQRGIGYMQPPTPASHIPQLRESITGGMKETSGVHEAWSGKAPSAQLNASAIIALQEAAGVRIRGVQRRLHRAVREMGILWLAHWKEFYTEDRLFRIVGKGKVEGFAWFRASDYKDMGFDVTVQATGASPFSKSLMSANLDKLLEGGVISHEEYLELVPADIFPKAEMLMERRKEKEEALKQEMLQTQAMLVMQMVQELTQQASAEGVVIAPETAQLLIDETMKIASMGLEEGQGMAPQGGGQAPGLAEGLEGVGQRGF